MGVLHPPGPRHSLGRPLRRSFPWQPLQRTGATPGLPGCYAWRDSPPINPPTHSGPHGAPAVYLEPPQAAALSPSGSAVYPGGSRSPGYTAGCTSLCWAQVAVGCTRRLPRAGESCRKAAQGVVGPYPEGTRGLRRGQETESRDPRLEAARRNLAAAGRAPSQVTRQGPVTAGGRLLPATGHKS